MPGSAKDPVAQLGWPMLMGSEKPEIHLMTYQSCLMNRISKLTDARSKPDAIPLKDQTDAVKKPPGRKHSQAVALEFEKAFD